MMTEYENWARCQSTESKLLLAIGWWIESGLNWPRLEQPAPFSWCLWILAVQLMYSIGVNCIFAVTSTAIPITRAIFGEHAPDPYDGASLPPGLPTTLKVTNVTLLVGQIIVLTLVRKDEIKRDLKAVACKIWTAITFLPGALLLAMSAKLEAYILRVASAHRKRQTSDPTAEQLTHQEVGTVIAGIVRRSASTIEHLEAEVEILRGRNAKLEQDCAGLNEREARLRDRFGDLFDEHEALQQTLTLSNETEAKLRAEIEKLRAEVKEGARDSKPHVVKELYL
jgi:FtsZ-binding cell division protein ZapB